MSIALIAAVAKNGCIGKSGGIPWKIPGEQLLFKQHTLGKVVFMGRKTWESIPERFRPLTGRINVVISRQTDLVLPEGVERFSTIADAIAAHAAEDICVIGGAEIYRQTIDQADTLFITHVDQEVEGDSFFPEIDPAAWEQVEHTPYANFSFTIYRRRTK